MRSSYLFTSESVSEGHPDKVADQISDAIVDLFLSKDPEARVACETMTTTNRVVLAGEIRGEGIMDEDGNWAPGVREEIEQAVRDVVKRIGYEQDGFHWDRFDFANHLHPQSAHIAQGVDAGENKDEGAGDQGIMFGFACDETPDLMPATLYYSHKILAEMAKDRHSGAAPFLEPDAKSQVTLRFEDGKPAKATAIVVSTQHKPGYDKGEKQAELHAYVKDVVAARHAAAAARQRDRLSHQPDRQLRDRRPRRRRRRHRPQDHRRHLWRRGAARRRRLLGQGPDQGRPLGGLCRALPRQEHRRRRPRQALHDPARLCDRRVASRCRSTSTPTAPARVGDDAIEAAIGRIDKLGRLTPRGIRTHLGLNKPIYAATAAYGHFGRKAEGDIFPWERIDLVDDLKDRDRRLVRAARLR